MFFMRKIYHNTSPIEWGICDRCFFNEPWKTLCKDCIDDRNRYYRLKYEERKNSWEYRIRLWLSKWIHPDNTKRK